MGDGVPDERLAGLGRFLGGCREAVDTARGALMYSHFKSLVSQRVHRGER